MPVLWDGPVMSMAKPLEISSSSELALIKPVHDCYEKRNCVKRPAGAARGRYFACATCGRVYGVKHK